ncbi:hypothetical protein DFQ27_003490 [Actinomortierella ambigua]|uniref:Uncharacterized protein n=1 Tax=Actinomortierella ambigua TaxID=1343610 RepID=A0A9P6U5J5_9FUNG|nr:hypothetical protein DFQ27_003490 [Actinomortierella ambigua]
MYTETAYIRFNKGMRTNIYGLTVVEELCRTVKGFGHLESSGFQSVPTEAAPSSGAIPGDEHYSDQTEVQGKESASFASTITDSASSDPTPTPTLTKSIFTDRIGRYVLVASSGLVTCYVGMEHSFEISLGLNQEVVSIDAYESACQGGYRVVMSIAIARAEESNTQFEMLFYGARTCAKTVMDHILSFPCTDDIQRIPIGWAPTKILHVPLTMDLSKMAILVGGGDTKVHNFIKDDGGNITEQPIEDYFPALATFQHSHNCILSMDVRDYPAFRVIAAGTQNGTLNVAIIPRDQATNELQHDKARNHSVILFSPITSLAIYTSRVRAMDAQGKAVHRDRRDLEPDDASTEEDRLNSSLDEDKTEDDVHLLMTCAIEQAWVYTAINRNGLAKRSEIAACGHHDSILTSYVMDIDWDGENELVIGTYGRQLMVFKQVHGYFVHQATTTSDAPIRYELYWNRRFAYPVYGISSADMNSDGVEELVVTTMYGISFFQADNTAAKRRLAHAINKMTESERIKLRLERLRAENLQLESEAEEQMARIQTAEREEAEAEEAAERAEAEKKKRSTDFAGAPSVESRTFGINDDHESESETEVSGASGEEAEGSLPSLSPPPLSPPPPLLSSPPPPPSSPPQSPLSLPPLPSSPLMLPQTDKHEDGDDDVLSDSVDHSNKALDEQAGQEKLEPHSPAKDAKDLGQRSKSPADSQGKNAVFEDSSEEIDPSSELDFDDSSDASEPEFNLKNDQKQDASEAVSPEGGEDDRE